MFTKSAAYYDLIYRQKKDYKSEAMVLNSLLSKLDPKPQRIIDIGCGTGEHAHYLSRKFDYEMDGIDIEPELLEIAATKNRGEFTVADMTDFSLPKRYDAALCLFSSIAYCETAERLRAAAKCIAGALALGGWVIVEAWSKPNHWKAGDVDAFEAFDEETNTTVVRARESDQDGDVSILKLDYHVQSPSGDVNFSEEHRLGLFSRAQMLEAFTDAGFSIRRVERGLLGSDLYIGTYTP